MAMPWERYQQEASGAPAAGPWAKYAETTKTPAPTDETGISDYASGFAGGLNRGLAGMLGLPVDLANRSLGAVGVPVSDAPFLGSAWFRDRMGDVEAVAGMEPGKMTDAGPDTLAGRIISRTGEEIGASIIPAGGMIAAGIKSAAAPLTRAGLAGGGFTPLERIGMSPVTASAGEAIAATGAGIGAGTARELYPDNPIAELGGQLIGGVAPSAALVAPTALAVRGGRALVNKMSPSTGRAQQVVQDYLGNEISGDAATKLAEANRVADEVPGFNPSLAERVGTPGMLAKQREVEDAASRAELDSMVSRYRQNESAVDRFASTAAPKAERGPDYVIDAAKRRMIVSRDSLETATGDMDFARRNLATKLPSADLAAEGATIRSALSDRLGEEHQAFERLATETGLNNEAFRVNFEPFKRGLIDAFDQSSRFQTESGKRVSAEPSVVKIVRDAESGQTFPALMELRADISAAIRRAERLPSTDDATLRGLRAMKARFDSELEAAVAGTNDPKIAQRYSDFRTRYRTEFIEPFRQRASHEVLHRDATGAYETPDERIVKSYFRAGGVTNIRQFKEVFSKDPAANQAVENVAIDSLRRAAVKDGVIDDRAFRKWLGDHESVLNELPPLNAKIRNLGEINANLAARQRDIARRKSTVEDSLLWGELRAIEADARTAEQVISRALASPRKMKQIAARVSQNPDARAALKRAIWDQVATFEPGNITRFLDENAETVRLAGLGDEHIKALKTIDAARVISGRSLPPRGSADAPSMREGFAKMFGVAPEMIANRLHTLNTGRSERTWVTVNLLTNILSRKQQAYVNDAFKAVLYDPEIAKDISTIIRVGKETPAAAHRLQARYFALGLTPWRDEEARRDQIRRLFNPEFRTPESVSRIRRQLEQQDPEAWSAIKPEFVRSLVLDDTSSGRGGTPDSDAPGAVLRSGTLLDALYKRLTSDNFSKSLKAALLPEEQARALAATVAINRAAAFFARRDAFSKIAKSGAQDEAKTILSRAVGPVSDATPTRALQEIIDWRDEANPARRIANIMALAVSGNRDSVALISELRRLSPLDRRWPIVFGALLGMATDSETVTE